jgi:hypothetical protein
MPCLTNENKTQICPPEGIELKYYSVLEIQYQSKIIRSASGSLGVDAETGATGCRDAVDAEAVGAKT